MKHIKGGSWLSHAEGTHSAIRITPQPDHTANGLSFRLLAKRRIG